MTEHEQASSDMRRRAADAARKTTGDPRTIERIVKKIEALDLNGDGA